MESVVGTRFEGQSGGAIELRVTTWAIVWTRACAMFALTWIVCVLPITAHSEGLVSNWDRVPVKLNRSDLSCPTAPTLSPDLKAKGYYVDSAFSVADPVRQEEYKEATDSYRSAGTKVMKLADLYRNTGDVGAAVCARNWLNRFSLDRALLGKMDGSQAHFYRAWMLSAFSISWLKVRDARIPIDPNMQQDILGWIDKLAQLTIQFQDRRYSGKKAPNNLHYWAGLGVMSAGIALDNRKYYDWGRKAFTSGANSVTDKGFLPAELARGKRALGYHIYASDPLVTMAELAAANGDDLYNANNGAVRRLVENVARCISDPALMTSETGVKQAGLGRRVHLGWAVPYTVRFGSPDLDRLLDKYPLRARLARGGEAPPAVCIESIAECKP
ncbi:alginate lyase family protein [Bordetella sp. 15P40C-2]|uniref:alginate lyase family protein n=1 Tax=Bordetella sp. 15P40C-2 TaxID=2572246 RepID=UPI001329CFFE|nr:alginate lyase family protein [Bordetella sp. 15P40C-2]MVW73289.1 hypothetical protein [Bordetella sp. 15P40C-2]